MDRIILGLVLVLILSFSSFTGCIEEEKKNNPPQVEIHYPLNGMVVSNIVMINGISTDADGDQTIKRVEIRINGSEWQKAEGISPWSFDWRTYEIDDNSYTISVRCWDGIDYSIIERINLTVDNPDAMESGDHKWALFIAAANFPVDNESKLGNGGLTFAEEMAAYLIEKCHYSTSNIIILFDDGWIRSNNGFGQKYKTLQERRHQYDITYGGATIKNVETSIEYFVEEANKFGDSEIFLWLFGHGYGDENDPYTGGKVLENSAVFLWDGIISDNELGDLLAGLNSKKTCIIVDACYSGGFADKTMYNFPTFFLLRSGIPDPGRIVMTGTSKFHVGYASTTTGPLFSSLWFEGLNSDEADGFRPGFFYMGRLSYMQLFRDGKVSVEEAFYYARYRLKTDRNLEEYSNMEPQIDDQYPHTGIIRSKKGMFLGK